MADSALTIGFDIGGTNLRAGLIDDRGAILAVRSQSVPRTVAEVTAAIVSMVDHLKGQAAPRAVRGVGLAVAGFIDPEGEVVRFAPHLPWRDYAVCAELEAALKLPVVVEHDANSAAWGEYRFGAAQGCDNWVLLALGTGIGAALMIDGKIYRGSFGTAPEFGHLRVVPNGRECPCGKRGCLERYCSGSALEITAREMAITFPGCSEESLSGKDVTREARLGNACALKVMEEFTAWLGIALSIVSDVLDPALIVIGGGLSQDADLFLPAAKEEMALSMVGAGHRVIPDVFRADLGGDAGMIGVADIARTRFQGE